MMVNRLWDLAMADPVTRAFVVVIIVVAAVLVLFEVWQLWFRRSPLRTALGEVEKAVLHLEPSAASVDLDIQEVPWLEAMLARSEAGDGFLIHRQRLVSSSYPPVLMSPAPRSKIAFAPGLLTALGVIGTFAGITVGLLDFDTSGGDATNTSIQHLIAGMKTAFGTSLLGLFFAAVSMVALAFTNNRRRHDHTRLRRLWEACTLDLAEVQADRIMTYLDRMGSDELASQQSAAAVAQNRAAEQLASAVHQMQASLSGFSAQAIGDHVKQGFQDTMRGEVVPVFQEMQRELSAIRSVMESQDERIMRTLLERLREDVIEPLASQIVESSKATRDASEAVSALHQELGGISGRLAGAAEQLGIFQRETLKSLGEFADGLQVTLTQFQKETRGTLESVAASMKNVVDESVTSLQGQREAFEASATQASATFRGIREDLEQALETQAREQMSMLEQTRQGVVGVLSAAQGTFDRQSETLVKTGEEARALMNSSRESLQSTLSGIDGALQDTRTTVQEELATFRLQYQASLESFFEEQNNLLEGTLGQQRDGLHGVVMELHGVFEEEAQRQTKRQAESDSLFARLATTMKEMQELAEALSSTSSSGMIHVRTAAKEIGRQVLELRRQYQDLDGSFRVAVSDGQQALAGYLDAAQSTYNEHFKRMDEASTAIHNRLLQTADLLVLSKERRRSLQERT